MPALPRVALLLLRQMTGLRVRHLAVAALGLTIALAALAVPFWWVGEQADEAAGIAGIVLVVVAYLSLASLVVVASAILLSRLLLTRIRGTLRVFGG